MMPPFKDRIGIRYGRLVVIKFVGWIFWLCKCDCGEEKEISGYDLQSGDTKSCGCLRREVTSKRNRKQIGKNHPNYTDGKSCGRTKEIYDLKEKVRKKANYKCQKCSKTQEQNLKECNKKLSVHHIDGDDTNNVEENMIALCYKCHRKTIKCRG